MKKYSLLFALILFTFSTYAQTFEDALRFSQHDYEGTARFTSMGGAFGALGGDFSTLSLNPGGLGVYRSSEFTFTPSISYNVANSEYRGVVTPDSRMRFAFSNMGYVGSYLTGNENGLVAFNLAVGYNRAANFNRYATARGNNSPSSMMDYFADKANTGDYHPVTLGSRNPFDTYNSVSDWDVVLAYNTFVIDTVNLKGGGFDFIPAVYDGDKVNQSRLTTESGSTGEYVFSIGGNISNKFYFGATFGIHDLFYQKTVQYTERAASGNESDFNSFNYIENFRTSGTGYNGKFGFIYRPVNALRFGAAIHTPTFYYLTDRYSAEMNSSIGIHNDNFSTPTNFYDYRLQTPLRAMGSMALMFGRLGLLSVDYEFINYASMQLSDARFRDEFDAENEAIRTFMKETSNIRIGGETWIGNVALRGGAIYNQSPDRDYDLSKYTYSAGIGYRVEGFFMDFAYALTSTKSYSTLYTDPSSGLPLTVAEKNYRNRFLLTLGFRF